ncbi:peptidoglycan D,D-transpeptidase FtsI family protein [Angustibacter peucedani]
MDGQGGPRRGAPRPGTPRTGRQPVQRKPAQRKPAQRQPTQRKPAQRQPTQRKPAGASRPRRQPTGRPAGRGRHPARQPGPRRPGVAHPQRRARAMFLGVCITLSLFAVQLLRLQALDASAMAQKALGSRLTTVPVNATRGQIVDRDGVVLATSLERYNVTVDQTTVAEYSRLEKDPVTGKKHKVVLGLDGAAHDLAAVLKMPVAEVRDKLEGTRRFAYVKKGVTPEVWREVDALTIPGIYPERTSQRAYPADGVGASVVGFVGKDNTPLAGLELKLDKQLTGTPGSVTYERDPGGRHIPTGDVEQKAAVPGATVQLTLDRDLQWKAEQVLAAKVAESGALSGTVVVMTKDGKILALANAPTFDPNVPSKSKPANLSNRALSEVYEPGSTSKVMTAAAAIEEGAVTAMTPFSVPGQINRAGKTFHDSHPHGVERLTFAGVLAKSSNVGTIMAGEKLSSSTMYSYLTKFGIGQPSGLAFPGESRGILAQPQDWSGSQRYTVLFGQGLSVNAVQAAGVYQTIANDGVRVQPQLVAGTVGADGRLDPAAGSKSTRVVSAKTAATLRRMLEGVVSADGTAPEARIPGYRVAGKTGTAQRFDPTCGCYRGYTGSFIGMAPADDPQLVVAVTLQRPVKGYYGGTVAAPVFKDVMTYALQKLQIPPTGSGSPSIRLTATDR